jgi:protein arginine kinase
MGGIYQISNQITLGKSEQDIIRGLQNVTKNVIDTESGLRIKALNQHRPEMENNVYRAYGILAYSRKISAKEAMDLLSDIRLGFLSGLLDMPKPAKQIYQIMMEIQPGHLQKYRGSELDELQRDINRADYLRKIFNEN